jgi:PAS domain S-box-containing protein
MRASAYVLRILIVVFGVAFLLNVGLAAKSTSTSVNALDALSQAGVLAALCAPLLYAWVLRDQAKRLSEASAAREGRAKFRALLDSIAEIAVIVDSDGRITDMNRMAEAVFGYEHTELLNQPIEYLMPERFREAHVAQRESYMANPRRMPLGSGRELIGRRRDGSEFPIEISLSPIESGGDARVLALATDISHRRRMERERQETNSAAWTDEAVLVTDVAGTIQFVNRAFERMTGFSGEEAIGKNPRILKSGEEAIGKNPRILKSGLQAKAFYDQMWEALRGGQVWESRFINRRKDGSLFHQDVTITPVVDAGGNITHFVSSGHEIPAGAFELRAANDSGARANQ